jgi:hypothetical protein
VIYQPQPESLEGNRLRGRSAVAVELDGQAPVFGVIWFDAQLHTDRAERTATIASLEIPRVRFPDQDEAKARRLRELIERELPAWDMTLHMDRLLSTLGIMEERAKAVEQIRTDAPVVLIESEPAVLITIDGEPQLRKEEGTDLERVINTPFTILRDSSSQMYYLNADAKTWYTSSSLEGEWAVADSVPRAVAERAPQPDPDDPAEEPAEDPAEQPQAPGPAPKIIIATEPTELIVIEGRPSMVPISGTDLLYLSNTDSDVLFDIQEQKYFILLSGRWYVSASTQGPWQYVPGEDVPEDFARIPEDHELGTVLYAVPGTDVAEEAVLDAQVPQTAVVDRSAAKLEVEYDGEPVLEEIEGTEMSYVVNTATPVIRAQRIYFACDEAVWFSALSPKGPWTVTASIPAEIYTIPPDNPLYFVTYVYIYKATPQVIYVGYTPGYTGTYVYHTTIVYGTGYWYRPWYGRYYYPRRSTWGFHVRWNPWSGWGFGFSYSNGPFRFTIGVGGWHRGGWWGPGRYRGYRHGYRHGYRRGARAGYRAGQRNATRSNIYRNQNNQVRTRPQSPGRVATTQPATRPNNVYADRQGNVQRRTDGGWENRTANGWRESLERTQPATGRTQQRPTTTQQRPTTATTQRQHLDRSYQTRQRGNQRASGYNRARGGARGGGRRRR